MFFAGKRTLAITLFAAIASWHPDISSAQDIHTIEIITVIRDISLLTFQPGEKSRQRIDIDFSAKTMSSTFDTGKTSIVGFDFSSIRNDFAISGKSFDSKLAVVTATGQTASRVGILPDIDYTFTLRVNPKDRKVWISGCHNEYPSYQIVVDGQSVYDRTQTGTAFVGLIGKCDVLVNEDAKQF